MSISVDCNETAPCCFKVTVTIPAADTQQAYKTAVREVAAKAQLPGFRRGKIPPAILLKNYAPQIIALTTEKLVDSSLNQAMEEQKWDFYSKVDFSQEESIQLYSPEQDFSFSFSVEMYPKIDLPQYVGLTVSKQEATASDAEVEEYIAGFLEQRSTFEVAQRPAQPGDMLQANYTAEAPEELLNDDQLKYLLKGENSWLMLREPELLPGIATALLGVSAGEQKDVELTFPADFYNEAMRNKTYLFHFEIQEIKGRIVPQLDQAFLQELKMESEEQLRLTVKEMLSQHKQQSEQNKMREQLLQILASGQEFPVPPTMLQLYKNRYSRELLQLFSSQQLKPEEVTGKLKENEDAIESRAFIAARQEIILREIGRKEKIEVSNEMLFNLVANYAERKNLPFRKAMREMQENGQFHLLKENLFRELALRHIMDMAQVEVIKEEA